MPSKYVLNIYPLAQKDLDKIVHYIANDLANPDAAQSLIDDFYSAFERILIFPSSCPFTNDEFVKDSTLRKLIVKKYIAFYRVVNNEVQVVRVLYGMSNYQELL